VLHRNIGVCDQDTLPMKCLASFLLDTSSWTTLARSSSLQRHIDNCKIHPSSCILFVTSSQAACASHKDATIIMSIQSDESAMSFVSCGEEFNTAC
jgi:hypothetical protein